ncbi:MAG: hypothetical protein QW607_10820 [Desulfurococcaceae archaeon]
MVDMREIKEVIVRDYYNKCFNWAIGRELLWTKYIRQGNSGKWKVVYSHLDIEEEVDTKRVKKEIERAKRIWYWEVAVITNDGKEVIIKKAT